MPAVFCLRLAVCLLALLPLLPATLVHPRFSCNHFLLALSLSLLALLFWRESPVLLTLMGLGAFRCFAGSVVWRIEGAPGGQVLALLTSIVLAAGLLGQEMRGSRITGRCCLLQPALHKKCRWAGCRAGRSSQVLASGVQFQRS
jgi:hypothetical protein